MQNQQNTYQTRFHGENIGSNPVGDARCFAMAGVNTLIANWKRPTFDAT
jgi:hypothetical protein